MRIIHYYAQHKDESGATLHRFRKISERDAWVSRDIAHRSKVQREDVVHGRADTQYQSVFNNPERQVWAAVADHEVLLTQELRREVFEVPDWHHVKEPTAHENVLSEVMGYLNSGMLTASKLDFAIFALQSLRREIAA